MLDRQRLEPFVRHFPENGLKVLLENPDNVRDVLGILDVKVLPRIDFKRMTVERTHFVQRDYRHLESDVVLQAPLRTGRKGRQRRVLIYILIEHQSEPDRFMAFRVLEYVVLIYRHQLRAASPEGRPPDDFRFQPVVPIVLYSGTRSWDKLEKVADLVELDKELAEWTPSFEPLFLNLGQTSTQTLAARGGSFGLLLRLIQQRKMRLEVFQETLAQVVRDLEKALGRRDRDRWLALVSYLQSLVFHEREPEEQAPLIQRIQDSVRNDLHRREVFDMAKTIAEMLKEEGEERGIQKEAIRSRQQMLLDQLRTRFKRIPGGIVKRIESTDNVEQLSVWIREFATADKLSDLSITPAD
jgi:ElaB/YqjD/DUF883 family membrane-anchored ribosome-binding protein